MAVKPYPQRIRQQPERYLGSSGRPGIYRLTDQLMQALVWGDSPGGGEPLQVSVHTDGTLEVERRWPDEERLWPALAGSLEGAPGRSLMAHHFNRCVQSSRSARRSPLTWERGNPYQAVYLAYAAALASRARVELCSRGWTYRQSYRGGLPSGPVEVSPGGVTGLRAELKLDRTLLSEDLPAYPFRIRLRELAALLPGLRISLRYKGFKPADYFCEEGLADLLRFMIPSGERCHAEPFRFEAEAEGLRYSCALFLVNSEMERVKSFAALSETYYGGLHERLLRQVVRETIRELWGRSLPVRRQSWENIAASRVTYHGRFAVTVPYQEGHPWGGYARTVPGLAGVVGVYSPHLEGHTPLLTRLVGPDAILHLRAPLLRAFRLWAEDHRPALQRWLARGEAGGSRRGRRRRSQSLPGPSGAIEDEPQPAPA